MFEKRLRGDARPGLLRSRIENRKLKASTKFPPRIRFESLFKQFMDQVLFTEFLDIQLPFSGLLTPDVMDFSEVFVKDSIRVVSESGARSEAALYTLSRSATSNLSQTDVLHITSNMGMSDILSSSDVLHLSMLFNREELTVVLEQIAMVGAGPESVDLLDSLLTFELAEKVVAARLFSPISLDDTARVDASFTRDNIATTSELVGIVMHVRHADVLHLIEEFSVSGAGVQQLLSLAQLAEVLSTAMFSGKAEGASAAEAVSALVTKAMSDTPLHSESETFAVHKSTQEEVLVSIYPAMDASFFLSDVNTVAELVSAQLSGFDNIGFTSMTILSDILRFIANAQKFDSLFVSDNTAMLFYKNRADAIMTSSILGFSAHPALSDAVNQAEALNKVLAKYMSDASTVSDPASIHSNMAREDPILRSESAAKHPLKVLSSGHILTSQRTMLANKSVLSAAISAETLAKTALIARGPDTSIKGDLPAIGVDKPASDSFSTQPVGEVPWTPAVLGLDVAVWLDGANAASFTLSGSSIDIAGDLSGNNRHATPATAVKPTYNPTGGAGGLGTIVFGSGADALITPTFVNPSGVDGLTVVLLARRTGTPVNFSHLLCKGPTNAEWSVFWSNAAQNNISYWRSTVVANNAAISPASTIANATTYLWSGRMSINLLQQFLFGTELTGSKGTGSNRPAVVGATALVIGSTPDSTFSANRFQGEIDEIVVLEGDVSDATIRKIEGYIAWKRGVEDDLAIGHPYEEARPMVSGAVEPYHFSFDKNAAQTLSMIGSFNTVHSIVFSDTINMLAFLSADLIGPSIISKMDTSAAVELLGLMIGRSMSESSSMSDDMAAAFNRMFTSTTSFVDTSVLSIEASKSDLLSLSENRASNAVTEKQDSLSALEQVAQDTNKPTSDAFSLAEDSSRSLSGSPTDINSFAEIREWANFIEKQNALLIIEQPSLNVEKPVSEALSVLELQSKIPLKSPVDAFSLAEMEYFNFGLSRADFISLLEQKQLVLLYSKAELNTLQEALLQGFSRDVSDALSSSDLNILKDATLTPTDTNASTESADKQIVVARADQASSIESKALSASNLLTATNLNLSELLQHEFDGQVVVKNTVAKTLFYHPWSDGTKKSKEESPAVFPGATWETRTAAQVGMNQTAIDNLITALGTSRGFLVKDGYQIAAWNETAKFDWASASKPVTTTLLGFAIEEGLLTAPTDLVEAEGWTGQFITKDEPMQFAHLANMVSSYMRAEAPGAAWAYNDYAMKLLHVTLFDNVFQEATPDAAALVNGRLGPLSFQDGSLYGPARDGYGVETSCRDMARIGWLWMNHGNWNGAQLLPEAWFDTYMQAQVAGNLPRTSGTNANGDYLTVGTYGGGTDQSAIGPNIYGFGWWFNNALGETANLLFPSGPADLIMANGHFTTEAMFMIPSLGLVFANYSTSWGNLLTDAGVADSTSDQLVAMIAATVSLFTDDFNRANASDLGSNWTPWIHETDTSELAIVSNTATNVDKGTTLAALTTVEHPADQWAEVTITGVLDPVTYHNLYYGLILRGTGTGATRTGYAFVVGGTNEHYIVRVDDDVNTQLEYFDGTTLNTGDVIRAEVQGSSLVLKVNGNVRATTTDANLTTGNPGISLGNGLAEATNPTLDNFSSGRLV